MFEFKVARRVGRRWVVKKVKVFEDVLNLEDPVVLKFFRSPFQFEIDQVWLMTKRSVKISGRMVNSITGKKEEKWAKVVIKDSEEDMKRAKDFIERGLRSFKYWIFTDDPESLEFREGE